MLPIIAALARCEISSRPFRTAVRYVPRSSSRYTQPLRLLQLASIARSQPIQSGFAMRQIVVGRTLPPVAAVSVRVIRSLSSDSSHRDFPRATLLPVSVATVTPEQKVQIWVSKIQQWPDTLLKNVRETSFEDMRHLLMALQKVKIPKGREIAVQGYLTEIEQFFRLYPRSKYPSRLWVLFMAYEREFTPCLVRFLTEALLKTHWGAPDKSCQRKFATCLQDPGEAASEVSEKLLRSMYAEAIQRIEEEAGTALDGDLKMRVWEKVSEQARRELRSTFVEEFCRQILWWNHSHWYIKQMLEEILTPKGNINENSLKMRFPTTYCLSFNQLVEAVTEKAISMKGDLTSNIKITIKNDLATFYEK